MCFSATASFGAGIALSAIGVASVKKAQSTPQLFFASIPLLFAVQQISEGCLWLALTDPAYVWLEQKATYVFLFFAQVLWPIWVPYALLRLEKSENMIKLRKILVGTGGLVSLYLGYCLLNFHVEASVGDHHIAYAQDYPQALGTLGGVLYIISTITPLFLTKIKYMTLLGIIIFTSYVISTILYVDYIVSVWCFFAAIISVMVFWIVYTLPVEERASM